MMNHCTKTFSELTNEELFKIFKERVAIFVVEQNCPYQEIDDLDPISLHHFFEEEGEIIAYDRIYPKGQTVHIGRVIVDSRYRKAGLGLKLLEESLDIIAEKFPDCKVEIEAQAHLQNFYGKVGFHTISSVYLVDDIPHVKMVLKD